MLLNSFLSGLSIIIALALPSKHGSDALANKAEKNPPVKWVVEKTSILRVSGKSNVNAFACDIGGYYEQDTLSWSDEGAGSKAVRLNGCLEIDVLKFDCHNRMLTNDLRKTLKAESYPKLKIRFLTLDHMPELHNNNQSMKGWVEVELAGVRKLFQLSYEFIKCGSSTYLLNGSRKFCFSDFKLTPPKKLCGLIQVKDDFNVDFQLRLDPVE